MRKPFDQLTEPLDPETQQMVDEVCAQVAEASDDPWADVPASGLRVTWAWLVALRRSGDARCRQRIFDLVDQRVRADRTLFVGANGYIYPWSQINEHGGRTEYEPDPETGELRRVLRFPAGPDERRRAA